MTTTTRVCSVCIVYCTVHSRLYHTMQAVSTTTDQWC